MPRGIYDRHKAAKRRKTRKKRVTKKPRRTRAVFNHLRGVITEVPEPTFSPEPMNDSTPDLGKLQTTLSDAVGDLHEAEEHIRNARKHHTEALIRWETALNALRVASRDVLGIDPIA